MTIRATAVRRGIQWRRRHGRVRGFPKTVSLTGDRCACGDLRWTTWNSPCAFGKRSSFLSRTVAQGCGSGRRVRSKLLARSTTSNSCQIAIARSEGIGFESRIPAPESRIPNPGPQDPANYLNSTRPRGLSMVAMMAGAGPFCTRRSSPSASSIFCVRSASGCSARTEMSVAPRVAVADGCGDVPQSMKYGTRPSARTAAGSV